jgi:hypothetical protein
MSTPPELSPRPHPAPRAWSARVALAMLWLVTCATQVDAAWTPAAAGSWMIVEAWKHGLGEQPVRRITTTLLRRVDGVPWFEHIDQSGRRWEDADAGTDDDAAEAFEPGGQDEFMTTQVLHVDGVPVPCRVIVNEKQTAPWSASDPVSCWIARSKRWQAIDTTLRVRVLKLLDLGTETRFRDGRRERAPGLSSSIVTSLHEPVRLHGRSYDCWVRVSKSVGESGAFAGRTTVWGCEHVPAGWVRRIRETRDPRDGSMTRLQEQLVDFQLR